MLAPAALTAIGLALLLLAEWRGWVRLRALGKTAAAGGFVWGGWLAMGSVPGSLGRAVFAGLCLSMVGDLFLLGRASRHFLLGLGAFLLAHLVYLAGFWSQGVSGFAGAGALLGLIGLGATVVRWLQPYLEPKLVLPLRAYVVAIVLMVASAVGVWERSAWLPLGAVCFMASDLAVARERFIQADLRNKLWGSPLYFGAQWMFIFGVLAD